MTEILKAAEHRLRQQRQDAETHLAGALDAVEFQRGCIARINEQLSGAMCGLTDPTTK